VDGLLGELAALATERADETQVPGVAIGVLREARAETTGVGVADVRTGRAVGPDTVFSIASITKTMTATLLASLVDRGRLDLEAPVRRYAPEFALADTAAAARVTVRHLLTHTGGWLGEDLPGPFDGDDALDRAAAACASLPQLTPPGALFSYNNAGFAVAGRVVEAASGRGYEAEARELLFRPLGMSRTDFTPPDDADVAAEHTVRDGAPSAIEPWSVSRSGRPIGGVRSTVRDLLAYARLQLDGARGVLSPERAAELTRPRVPRGNPGASMGLAWFVDERGGRRLVSHGGATVTHMSLLTLVPDAEAALIVLTNGARGAGVAAAVTARFLERLGMPTKADPRPIPMTAETLREYAGRYEWPTSDLELSPDGDALILRLVWKGSVAVRPPVAPMRLGLAREDGVVCLDGPQRGVEGDFIRDAGGRIRFFRWAFRARPRVTS
jgi:CubicO group peptidase (beta-lactamase class C family)